MFLGASRNRLLRIFPFGTLVVMKPLQSQNYYEILGISRTASPEEIRKAYELSRQTFGRDSLATYSLFSDDENQEIYELINRAYQTLFNANLRRDYDAFLDREEARTHPNLPAKAGPVSKVTAQGKTTRIVSSVKPISFGGMPSASKPVGNAQASPKQPTVAVSSYSPKDTTAFVQGVTRYDGKTLEKAREFQGMSLEDLAEFTKVRLTYLAYLEQEKFSGLPAQIYVRGFVKLVANALGLPMDKVVADYMAIYAQATHPQA